MKAVIQITDNAANRVKELVKKRSNPTAGIRIGVKQGGCTGLAYTFEYADVILATDEVVVDKDVTILIESKALLHIIGTTLDFIDEKTKSGFVFINPNEKGRCGCGESFYT